MNKITKLTQISFKLKMFKLNSTFSQKLIVVNE